MEEAVGLARFACDFCRQKKLKCSRELPKCNTCKPWPGGCEYSRDKSSSFLTQTSPHPMSPEAEPAAPQMPVQPGHIGARLQHLEQAIQSLTDSVDRALLAIPTVSPRKDAGLQRQIPSDRTAAAPESHSDPGLYVGPSHSFSFLKETPAIIEATPQCQRAAARESAYSELRSLSNALTVEKGDQEAREGVTAFYVPSRPAGYRLISLFLEQAELGEPFFRIPPEDIVRQVVFEPQRVRERAWVVYFNYMLLSAVSAKHYGGDEADKLRRNTQLALNDSSIFLEPREANIQALTLLAMHGEDYAAPNLSWMLLGHACRQAEALGLHAPAHQDLEARQQKLCLFWLLFMVDKSCSLAFGRPAFLPTSLYCNVPLPEDRFLLRFHPHDKAALGNRQALLPATTFGAVFFSRSIELSKLTGSILDVLATGGSSLAKRDIRSKLDAWYKNANQILVETMNVESVSANAGEVREMALGVNSFKFHYLHVLIVLLKGDESSSSLRTSSAREALSLLPSMVSNWSSVYNGVVWKLLYYPFVPFFVVFENIVHRHRSLTPSIEQDLGLLSTTVTYFASMRSQVRMLATVCSRLQHVATIFLQLAQIHVGHGALAETPSKPMSSQTSNTRRPGPYPDRQDFPADDSRAEGEPARSYAHSRDGLAAVGVEEPDLASFLEWLPADIDATWPMFETERQGPNTLGPTAGGAGSYSESFRGRKRTIDSTFDWFSWDAYYSGAEANRSFQ